MSEDSIYRFDSYSHFKDVIRRKALAFVHYSRWNDPEEGLLFSIIGNKQGRVIIRRLLNDLAPRRRQFIIMALYAVRQCIHAQSWTKIPENEYFWQGHSENNDIIRLETSLDKIKLNQTLESKF